MGPALTPGLALESHPGRYQHWQLAVEPLLAVLVMNVAEDVTSLPGYKLTLNTYDLGVDIELADAVNRLRFEHPEVRAVIVTGAHDRVFSAGANISMLASAPPSFRINFLKCANETRLAMEEASTSSGQHYIAACNGTTAAGGYELALACDEIYLVDDDHSAVSLPEVPLFGLLPATGGLARLTDKRKVRRDLADLFCTLAEGVKGRRAVEWRLVDEVFTRHRFQQAVRERALAIAGAEHRPKGPGITLDPIAPRVAADHVEYRHVTLALNPAARTAELAVRGPEGPQPETAEAIREAGAAYWPLRAFREIDDALLRLRFHHEEIGVVLLKTRGALQAVRALDATLHRLRQHWFVNEILLLMSRTLRRMDLTGRSFFALIDQDSCFAGSLYELALAADRIYMLRDEDGQVRLALTALNCGCFPMSHGPSRLAARFLPHPDSFDSFDTPAAEEAGLVTRALDEIDWDHELRQAVEDRASLSPDALTALEANLRFPGENGDARIFGRLAAWQNWLFARPNATGPHGALTLHGKPERPRFDWKRT